jgi:hypothetical protein
MPISYELDRNIRRVRTTVAGPVTVNDILNHLEAACREQVLSYAELIDARKAGPPILSPTDIRLAASRVRNTEFDRQALGPRAVIVNDLAMFGMTRMFVALVSDFFPMNVFREPLDAEEWLAERTGQPHPTSAKTTGANGNQ